MKPNLQERRVVEVMAARSWGLALEHRVYSCPDTHDYDFVQGATALILRNRITRARVPLEITAVVRLAPEDEAQLDALAQPLRTRLNNYRNAIEEEAEAEEDVTRILQPGVAHRFYFLSEEPWPEWLQILTTPEQCPAMEWTAILSVCTEPSRFFGWPQVGALLWPGCTRGDENQQHQYPPDVVARLFRLGIGEPDTRNNGPAIMAFLAAGGIRPTWGREGWPIHHIYDGTGLMGGVPQEPLHAVHRPQHFTHSAGLVAAHPVAHHLAHQSKLLKELLRREAFLRFGYDPMGAFSGQ